MTSKFWTLQHLCGRVNIIQVLGCLACSYNVPGSHDVIAICDLPCWVRHKQTQWGSHR